MGKYIGNDVIVGIINRNKVHFMGIMFGLAILIIIINSGHKRTKKLDEINSHSTFVTP